MHPNNKESMDENEIVEPEENLSADEPGNNDTKAENTIEEEEVVEQPEPEENTETQNTNGFDELTVENLNQELAEAKDKYVRIFAEFDNFRRRTAKEKLDLTKYATEDILKSLLTVLDDFERAQKSFEKNQSSEMKENELFQKETSAMKEGISLVYNKLLKVLEQKGLKAMESSIGQVFDVEKHESITQIPAPNEEMKGKVMDEIEKGYYLHEKVLRFAKVVIGS